MPVAGDGPEPGDWRLLSVVVDAAQISPCALVSLSFDDELDDEDEISDRTSFDQAYQYLLARLSSILDRPTWSGDYYYPHRPGFAYLFAGWTMTDATMMLAQDERDIQFGFDVTLWVLPQGHAIAPPIRILEPS